MALTPISSSRPWSDLPRDLLSKIGKILDTRIDVLRFRSVCSSWRSSIISLSSKTSHNSIKLPFPIFPGDPYLNPNLRGHFLVTESVIYALQPLIEVRRSEPKIWVVKVQESSNPGKVILKDPLSRLCPKDMAAYLPKVLNLLDYKFVEISKVHELEFIDETETPILDPSGYRVEYVTSSIKQVAINSSSLENIDDSFVIMALHRNGNAAMWRMWDAEWNIININCEMCPLYDNIVFHGGRFFVADRNGLTLMVDPVSLQTLSSFGTKWPYISGTLDTRYLVKSSGDLFSVVKKSYFAYRDDDHDWDLLTIYKFNEEISNWVKVDGLNGQAFITTDYNSFSLSSTEFVGFQGNCVYFVSNDLVVDIHDYPDHAVKIYDLEDFCNMSLLNFPTSRNILWPPPKWLK